MIQEKEILITKILYGILIAAVIAICVVAGILIYQMLSLVENDDNVLSSTYVEEKDKCATIITSPPAITPNRFDVDDFAYNAQGYLTCVSEPCLMGIDVSSWQPNIDWEKVKAAGFQFVMIRVGGRSYGQSGRLYDDDLCQSHYEGAKAAGLLVGAYFFSQAVNTYEAEEEAYFALEKVAGWELDLPLVYDWEYIDDEKRTAFIYEDVVTGCVKTFCDIVENHGYESMFYVSPWFGRMNLEELKDYQQWLALYKDQMDYDYHFDMWQYTSSGSVPGINGPVDIDIYFPPQK